MENASTVPRTRLHWPEYLIEAGAIATFMVVACVCGAVIFHPGSLVHHALGALGGAWVQRAVMGVLMGLTLAAIVYSPWGRRSGAHLNPAFTLAFLRLGKAAPRDAAGYGAAQFAGAVAGVLAARALVGAPLAHPAVRYVVTAPGAAGAAVAFAAEMAISALQMTLVLRTAASARWSRYTGVLAAAMVAAYVTLESPLSGMSMNPARSFGSAAVAGEWEWLWIYFAAPLAGMLAAAERFARQARERLHHPQQDQRQPNCGAKLAHGPAGEPCIFCEHVARRAAADEERRLPPAVRSPYSMPIGEGSRMQAK